MQGARVNFNQNPTVRDWPEDLFHENGNYNCKCVHCGSSFIGHKRRVCCKVCANPIRTPKETDQ